MSLSSPGHARRIRLLVGIAVAVVALAALAAAALIRRDASPAADVFTPQPLAAVNATVAYSTFLGGSKWDEAVDIEVDGAGNIYVAGFTDSPQFPTANAAQARFGGVIDAFVAKVSPDGRRLLYSTYLGGSKMDAAASLAIDRAGNAYVTGRTESTDFPTRSALQAGPRGRDCQRPRKRAGTVPCHDAFVTKLSPSGRVLYSTYLGGRHNDEALAIAVDRRGAAYISGNTESPDFPVRNALQRRFAGIPCEGDVPCPADLFVTKLSANGRRLLYSTYLGGSQSDRSGGIAVDTTGSAYVLATTRSPDFPTRNALQRSLRGVECGLPPVPCTDVLVARLTVDGRALRYSTYLGGSKGETAGGIAVDRAGNAYVTGSTDSRDFPTANALQEAADNSSCLPSELCSDAFVTSLRADGRALRYSTYLSGSAEEQGLAIALDAAANAYVAGSTTSRNFRTEQAIQARMGGYIDAFLVKLQPTGASAAFSTYLGGSEAERSTGVAVDDRGTIYVAGRTLSPNFPTSGALQPALGGDIDAFVARLR